MSDLEKETFRQIGMTLVNEYRQQHGLTPIRWLAIDTPETSAFIRSIQLHEKTKKELQGVKQEFDDFKQKVSDVVELLVREHPLHFVVHNLSQFIIPKPDPLVDVLLRLELSSQLGAKCQHDADAIRAALDAAGFEIREKNGG